LSESKLFDMFINSLNFDISEYLVEELTELQKEVIDDATFILKDNIVGELKALGGSIKKNEEKFNELLNKANKELEREKYKDIKKDLKDYLKKLSEMIIKTCTVIIPVKELPWMDVIFCTIPTLVYDGKVQFYDNQIAYYGEVKCFTGRTTIYGKIKGEEPLFAPLMGNLDLGGFKIDETKSIPKAHNFPYINAIIKSFDSPLTKNQLAKYHEGYQRHGDPICDFFMKDSELMSSMNKISPDVDSEQAISDINVCSIIIPLPADKKSLIVVTNQSSENTKYEECFEALLKLSAASCNVPAISMDEATASVQDTSQGPGAIRTPGGQELKVWTSEELAQQAQQRLSSQPNLPTWTVDDLAKFSQERGSGIPEGMEVWTEEQLQELAKERRGGALNIPEWKPDESLIECSNCGYSLRPGWTTCPICETPVGEKPSEESSETKGIDEKETIDNDSNQEAEKNENKES